MDVDQNQNQSPLFYRWDGEPPGPALACLSPFVVQLFPSVNGTFHPPARQSHFEVCPSAPGGDCDILLLPVYYAPFLFYAWPTLLGINVPRSCASSELWGVLL